MNIRITTGITWLKMAICLDRWQNVFFFDRHKSFQHGLMATFKPCPDCAKQGIVSPIVPRKISETVAIWKCNSTATTGCIYPMSQSLEFFKSQFVPVSSIDERMFRRYVHYDVRSDPDHSDTNNSMTPQSSPSDMSLVAEMNVVQSISTLPLPMPARSTEEPVARTSAVANDSISVRIPEQSASTRTSSPFSDDLPPRRQRQLPVVTTDAITAKPLISKSKIKDVTCKGDELLNDAYIVNKRPPPRPQTSTRVPVSFLQHLARKRPNTDFGATDKKKEQSLPSMDKFFVRSTKAKSLIPSFSCVGGADMSFDAYRPSSKVRASTTAAAGTAPYPSAYSPNTFSYPPMKRSTDDSSQKSDDGSSSSQGKPTKDSRLFSSNVRNLLVSSIATRKTPQGKMIASPGSNLNRMPASVSSAQSGVPTATIVPHTMSLPPALTTSAETAPANIEFDMTFDPFSLGDWSTTAVRLPQYAPPAYESSSFLPPNVPFPATRQSGGMAAPSYAGAGDFFDYVPNFATTTSSLGLNGDGNEQTPFFVDVDDPASSSAVVYQQL